MGNTKAGATRSISPSGHFHLLPVAGGSGSRNSNVEDGKKKLSLLSSEGCCCLNSGVVPAAAVRAPTAMGSLVLFDITTHFGFTIFFFFF